MKLHFIGIGGIGVSGLAFVRQEQGHQVQGSDAQETEITNQLQDRGVRVFLEQEAKNITSDIDLVVYSEAVPSDNPELIRAKELGIKCLSGAEALAELAKDYFLIAVSGMHGKTTTASMIAKIMNDAGLDPTYIIGAKNDWRLGQSKYLIIEADDYKAKLLNYYPDILVLTNIDEEHLDYFRDLNHILEVFKKYSSQVKKIIIYNQADKNIKEVIKSAKCQTKVYQSVDFKLTVAGKHNQSNAGAGLAVAQELGIDKGVAVKSLASFKAVWRRLEEKEIKIRTCSLRSQNLVSGKVKGHIPKIKNQKLKIILDYAHHPTEIKAVFEAVVERHKDKKVWVVFQPHQYQRTYKLFDKFVEVLKTQPFDKLIITDIYDVKGRENKEAKAKVSSQKLAQAIGQENVVYLEKEKLAGFLRSKAGDWQVLLIMTAGDIYQLAEQLSTG